MIHLFSDIKEVKELCDLNKKDELINELIHFGIYKLGNLQLFELSISDLEEEVNKIKTKGST